MLEIVDWNNDGKKDLLVGDAIGYVQLLLNKGTNDFPVFDSVENLQMGGSDLIVGDGRNGYAAPVVADWNKDGKKDLLVGNWLGDVAYFENVGTDAEPLFTQMVRLDTGGPVLDVGGSSRLDVADWDGDGNLDLLIGNAIGEVFVTRAVEPDDLKVAPGAPQAFSGLAGGPFSPDSVSYTVSNDGAASIDWTASSTASWLNLFPLSGTLAPGGTATVFATLNSGANALEPGQHTGEARFINVATGTRRTRVVQVDVQSSGDFFTQLFTNSEYDLAGKRLILYPDRSASSYRARIESASGFSTDPAGGTDLVLGDDGYTGAILSGGKKALIYGAEHAVVTVSANGYLVFGVRDTSLSGTIQDHFRHPRVSGLFTDLNPTSGGAISWKQLDDRAVFTWEDVPQYGYPGNLNTFQIEMFFSGRIQITWLRLEAYSGLIGISEGMGVPEGFIESDLSEYAPYTGEPAEIADISIPGYEIDTLEVGKEVYADRGYTFLSPIPLDLQGQTYIKTLNNDKDKSGWDILRFTVDQPVKVIIAHDARFNTLPGWMRFWEQRESMLIMSDTQGAERFLYTRDYSPGTIALGGNRDTGTPMGLSMYSVIIVPRDPGPSGADGAWERYR